MVISLAVLCFFAALRDAGDSAQAVLARMDKAAPSFQAASASLSMKTFTAILNETTSEEGLFKIQRRGAEVRAILDFSNQSDARQVSIAGKTIRIYYPKTNQYQDYDLGKSADLMNQFLLLGFGSSGKELAASYDITAEGEEKIADRETTKLQLIPKSAGARDKLSKVEIWVPNDAAYPVQQQFFAPSGNYRIVTYGNLQLNPPVKGKLELKLPSGAKRQIS